MNLINFIFNYCFYSSYCCCIDQMKKASNLVSYKSNIVDSIQESEDNLDNFEDKFEDSKENDYTKPNSQVSIENERHHTNWMNVWRVIDELEGLKVERKK